jgi:hypothetical protein
LLWFTECKSSSPRVPATDSSQPGGGDGQENCTVASDVHIKSEPAAGTLTPPESMVCKPEKAVAETEYETGSNVKADSKHGDIKNTPALGNVDNIKSDEIGVKEEEEAMENEDMATEGKQLPQYWNYQWPKVRDRHLRRQCE